MRCDHKGELESLQSQSDARITNENESLMLQKNVTKLIDGEGVADEDCNRLVAHYEYTVIYSDSYEVPVMYFSISNQSK